MAIHQTNRKIHLFLAKKWQHHLNSSPNQTEIPGW